MCPHGPAIRTPRRPRLRTQPSRAPRIRCQQVWTEGRLDLSIYRNTCDGWSQVTSIHIVIFSMTYSLVTNLHTTPA